MPGSDTGVGQRLDVARPIEQQVEREVARTQERRLQRERQSLTPGLGRGRVIHSAPLCPRPPRTVIASALFTPGTVCVHNSLYLLTPGVGPRIASLLGYAA